eukprot:4761233-Alexandrium_andersonii.AAC.1
MRSLPKESNSLPPSDQDWHPENPNARTRHARKSIGLPAVRNTRMHTPVSYTHLRAHETRAHL